jgi:hypothetical protein
LEGGRAGVAGALGVGVGFCVSVGHCEMVVDVGAWFVRLEVLEGGSGDVKVILKFDVGVWMWVRCELNVRISSRYLYSLEYYYNGITGLRAVRMLSKLSSTSAGRFSPALSVAFYRSTRVASL